ncbi:MAG TPA: histidine phosphatase family protein [Dehalococcoidia bacterium]|nr:histidine phosphatase family protein [Dehalococcoidia bacterium]
MPASAASGEPCGERTFYLVRHGACERAPGPGQGRLNDLGREQAELIADALADRPIEAIHVSTLQRAGETAEAVLRRHLNAPVRRAHLPRECIPPVTDAQHSEFKDRYDFWPDEERAGACAGWLDRAHRRYFKLTRGPAREKVVVAHGNAIRYLVACALGADPRGWLAMDTHNCGLTRIRIERDRGAVLISFNETGHLRAELRTL